MSRSVIDCREVIARVRGARARRIMKAERLSFEVRTIAATRADAGEDIEALAREYNRTEQTILSWHGCWLRGVGPWYRHGARWLPHRAQLALVSGGRA